MRVYVCWLACLDRPLTENFKEVHLNFNITMIMHLEGDHELKLRTIARVQRRLPGVETTEVEGHMATYCLFSTNHQRQVAHRQYKFRS